MKSDNREQRIKRLLEHLWELSDSQLSWTEEIVAQFRIEPDLMLNPDSDLVDSCVLHTFGDALQIHHCLSIAPLSKDRFEYALVKVLSLCGIPAELADKGNPGHDITIRGVPFSLKTQADKSIKKDFIHISKFMELGKGPWEDEDDLVQLRDQFFAHMKSYKRILQLRRIIASAKLQGYELIEIPKDILQLADRGLIEMKHDSAQYPKPGSCSVFDENHNRIFELYFDGGTERKLQIKHLDKRFAHSMQRGILSDVH